MTSENFPLDNCPFCGKEAEWAAPLSPACSDKLCCGADVDFGAPYGNTITGLRGYKGGKAQQLAVADDWNRIRMKHIIVWAWRDAPQYLKDLSTYGGDEDWVVEVPPHLKESYVRWLPFISSSNEGEDNPIEHPGKDGWTVYIGTH